jgi:thiol-disulfide isomerase/thioredoxin
MNPDADRSPDHTREAAPVPASRGGTKALIGALLAGTVGLIVLLFVRLSEDGKIRPGPVSAHAECAKGQRDCLPELSYVDTNGTAYPRDTLAGKVVLVNFWATWCRPCEAEIPDLSRVYDKYKAQGVLFLGVVIDNPDNQQLLNFQSDHDMTFPVVRASRDLMAAYNNPDAYPTTFVFDRTGKQIYHHVGVLRERELETLMAKLVAQN